MVMMTMMMMMMMVVVEVGLKMTTWLHALEAAFRATNAKSLLGALRLPSDDFKLHLIRERVDANKSKHVF